jgi:hypothetical protein
MSFDHHRFLRLFLPGLLLLFSLPAAAQTVNTRPVLLTSTMYPYAVQRDMWDVNEVFHPLHYFGVFQDTISPGAYWYPPLEYLPDSSLVNRDAGEFRDPLPGDFSIDPYLQDTVDNEYSPFGSDSMSFYIAFPVVVTNLSADTLAIGFCKRSPFCRVDLVLEGKDENGHWQALETVYYPIYGDTEKALALPAGQIVVTSVFRYGGVFETDLRLRLGTSYSAVFRGWVNPEAFP